MTMTKPEMDVVRFNESDVIVASGPIPQPVTKFIFKNFNNGVDGDATMNDVKVGPFEEITAGLGDYSKSYFQYKDNKKVHFGDLHNNEENNVLGDGTYVKTGEFTIDGDIFNLWQNQ